jgi:hypothetical protein
MSTPSGTSFDPSDPSHYAPKKRERSAAEQPSAAPQEPSPERDAAPAPAQLSSTDAPSEERGATPPTDADLQRLETSLRWLQREGSTGRLPRAVQLPPVSGLRHAQADGAKPREDHFIDGFRLPSSLAPERVRVPPPLRERSNPLRGSLRVLVVSIVAIPVAYYISFGAFSLPWSSPPAPAAAPPECCTTSTQLQVPKDPVRLAAIRPARKDDVDVAAAPPAVANAAPAPAPGSDQGPALGSDRKPDVSTTPAQPEAEPAAAPPAAPPGTRLVKTVRELDPEAVKLLMQQGQQFVAAGDFVTARIVYQRAAEAGDATAALAMGATFDPTVLAKLGARGVVADVEKARFWYQKAQAFGSPEAPHRIEMLANR